MKNLIITTLLTLFGFQSYSQGLFMVGAGTASNPSPNAPNGASISEARKVLVLCSQD